MEISERYHPSIFENFSTYVHKSQIIQNIQLCREGLKDVSLDGKPLLRTLGIQKCIMCAISLLSRTHTALGEMRIVAPKISSSVSIGVQTPNSILGTAKEKFTSLLATRYHTTDKTHMKARFLMKGAEHKW